MTPPTLDARELEEFRELLCQSPGLWPVSIVMAEVGVDATVAACRDAAMVPPVAAQKLRYAGYRLDKVLPEADDLLGILWGIRVRHAMHTRKPLQRVARDLGFTLKQVQGFLSILSAHQSSPAFAAFLRVGPNEAVGQ